MTGESPVMQESKDYGHNPRKLQSLTIAIYNHPESVFPKGYKLGEALKHNRDYAKNVPAKFGSYEKAWNSVAWARDFYGIH